MCAVGIMTANKALEIPDRVIFLKHVQFSVIGKYS